jgi:trehalos_R_Bsub: trehalose operon repressor
MMMY